MGGPDVEAMAVTDDHVAAIGTADELMAQFPTAERVDLGDRIVIPGLNDAHVHLAMAAESELHLDLSYERVSSIAEIRGAIAARAATVPAGSWIQGVRYDDARIADGRLLTRWDIDAAAPHHPVVVLHVAGHWGILNSVALQAAGFDDSSIAPDGGAFGRDAAGHLNGVLFEQALFDVAYPSLTHRPAAVIPEPSPEAVLAGLVTAQQRFHAAGLTSIGEALVGAAEMSMFKTARQRDLLTMRVNMLVAAEHYRPLEQFGIAGDDRLRIGGIKTFVDGAIGGRTCLLEEPFEGRSDDYGIQTRTTDELRDIVRTVHGAGSQVCVHANGDRAIGVILGLFEEAQRNDPRPGLGHRVEHCTVVTEDILTRLARLGATAVPFGSYVHYYGERLQEWYGNRVSRMFAHRSLLDAGVAVAGSSDFPCGPYQPLLGVQSCVTRRGWDGVESGPNQRISVGEALRLYTVGSANASGEGDVKGRLKPGFLADFVVLADDPRSVVPDTIGSIPVLETYVGGRQVWTAAAQQARA